MKTTPSWEPERFEGFWAAYPRDEERLRAIAEWDALPQDRELLQCYGGDPQQLLLEISRGLKRHLECREWRENVGIHYAWRWLRERRWEEKRKQPLQESVQECRVEPERMGWQ